MVRFLPWTAEDCRDGERVGEDGADGVSDVGFVAVEEAVEVDGGEVGADAFEAGGGVVTGFARRSVV